MWLILDEFIAYIVCFGPTFAVAYFCFVFVRYALLNENSCIVYNS